MADKPIMVKLSLIRENPWNPNAMSETVLRQTIANVRRFGFNQPILVRPIADEQFEYEVVDGAHRFRAAKACDLTQIPVIVREFTDAEAKAQTIAMNALRGEMDSGKVAELIREIDGEGIDGVESLTDFIGYTADELAEMEKALAAGANETPPPPADDQRDRVKDGYYLVVTCKNETHQLGLLERLEEEGLECRVVVS